jgi:hypothetical protein
MNRRNFFAALAAAPFVPLVLTESTAARMTKNTFASGTTGWTRSYQIDGRSIIDVERFRTELAARLEGLRGEAHRVWVNVPHASLSRCALVDNGPGAA